MKASKQHVSNSKLPCAAQFEVYRSLLHVQNLIACLMLTWLVQVRSQFRKIFVAMGFEEMMTNAYVENRWELFSCAPHGRLALTTHA